MTPIQTDTLDSLVTPALYVLAGLAFGATAYLTSDHETFRPRQLAKTLLVYAIAGGIVYAQGDALSEPAVVGATALAAPVANTILDAVMAPSRGGSPNRGRGAVGGRV